MPEKFTCANCGKIFDKTVSEEEALAELHVNFRNIPVEDCVVVCDLCYIKAIQREERC